MRWPWSPHPREVADREAAEQALRETLDRWETIRAAADELREHRIRNGFSSKVFARPHKEG